MRYLVLLLVWLLVSCAGIKQYSTVSVTPFFVPPHHEPVFDNSHAGVARYGVRGNLDINYRRLFYSAEFTEWGMQDWKDIRGIRGTDAWRATNWTAEWWAWDLTHKFGFTVTDRVSWWNEYYITSEKLCCYHWLTGVKVKLW